MRSKVPSSRQVPRLWPAGASPLLVVAGVLAAMLALVAGVSVVSPSIWTAVPFVNGVLGPSASTVTPTVQAVTSSDQVVTPQVDTATSSAETVAPSSLSVSAVTYPAAAGSSSQVIAPGSFSPSPVAYSLTASSSSQVIAPGSFSPSPAAYPLLASSSAQVISPSSFGPSAVTYPRPATSSAQTIAPSSFAQTPEQSTGPDSAAAAVSPTAQTVTETDTSRTPWVNGVLGSTEYVQTYSEQPVTPSSTSPTPWVNGVLGPTTDSADPTTQDLDTDSDGFPDAADNCPNTPNPGQENNVHPGTPAGDHCEDPDTDGLFDIDDPCPANPDCDGDSLGIGDPFGLFLRDGVEVFIGTLVTVACAATPAINDEDPDALGPDWDDSQDVDGSDLFLFAERFGTELGVPPPVGKQPYWTRFDIYPTDASLHKIDGSDLFVLASYFGNSCP